MKKYADPQKTLVFVFIAALLMIITDFVFSPTIVPPGGFESPPPVALSENSEIQDYESVQLINRAAEAEEVKEDEPWIIAGLPRDVPQPDPIPNNAVALSKVIKEKPELKIKKDILPPVKTRAVPPGKGQVVIIIDDMGMDRKHSLQVIDMPYPLTLAFLPYAPKLPEITKQAIDRGHELIIHVPMQPIDSRLNVGPLALRDDMAQQSFDAALEKIFASFDGYVGINNHMGSKLTQDRKAMDRVMEALAKRNLLFVDSKTIPNSVAADSAAKHGLAFAERDVFLDHENTKEFVMDALHDLEIIAKRRGYAVAIGHPKEATIQGLKEWLPTLKDKGLTLVAVSKVAHKDGNIVVKAEAPKDNSPYTVIRPIVSYSSEPFGPAQALVPPPGL